MCIQAHLTWRKASITTWSFGRVLFASWSGMDLMSYSMPFGENRRNISSPRAYPEFIENSHISAQTRRREVRETTITRAYWTKHVVPVFVTCRATTLLRGYHVLCTCMVPRIIKTEPDVIPHWVPRMMDLFHNAVLKVCCPTKGLRGYFFASFNLRKNKRQRKRNRNSIEWLKSRMKPQNYSVPIVMRAMWG